MPVLRGPPQARQPVLVRFVSGSGTRIVGQARANHREWFRVTAAMMRYAGAVACATMGGIDPAAREADGFDGAMERLPDSPA